MRLVDFLDKGASVHPIDAPCLTMAGQARSYAEVQRLSWSVGRALARSGIGPGDKVAVLSGNDPVAFSSVFGISRAGAVWCPVNPRNEAAENRELLALLDCRCLIFAAAFAPLVAKIAPELPALTTLVCLDGDTNDTDTNDTDTNDTDTSVPGAVGFADWLAGLDDGPWQADPVDDVVMIAGTGGTTGKPKGVMLTGRNIETMAALTLISYPFEGSPVYLAFAPLTHAAGVLCFPIMALGGEIVIMAHADLPEFLALIARHRVTHTYLPPTVIYSLLDHPALASADLTSLQCLWYGAAPMSAVRLEQAIGAFGPVLGQLFGQTEAPMFIAALPPSDHLRADGTLATERFTSAGRPTPLTTVAIMDEAGRLLPPGERGEIVVRGPLVMAGYYQNPAATAEASRYGWHHTGDVGYLDAGGYLYIVDRLKDMIITGGFNVYSAEVEQAVLAHPAVLDCAVVGLPDDKWGERVTAIIQPLAGRDVTADEIRAWVKDRLGSVKSPKQVEIWPDLPRSRVGKILKAEVKSRLLDG
ncbi:MAG TPA: AMP-binding protein [Trebonia sp.]|nr:AMP-binding protein [Trebonia sp.]